MHQGEWMYALPPTPKSRHFEVVQQRDAIMHAISYQLSGDIARDEALANIELPTPVPSGRDIGVRQMP